LLRTAGSKYFPQNRRVTWVLDLKIDSVADVIEKSFETGIAVFFGGLFGSLVSRVRKDRISSGVMDSKRFDSGTESTISDKLKFCILVIVQSTKRIEYN
jgi:hypothetical protein